MFSILNSDFFKSADFTGISLNLLFLKKVKLILKQFRNLRIYVSLKDLLLGDIGQNGKKRK